MITELIQHQSYSESPFDLFTLSLRGVHKVKVISHELTEGLGSSSRCIGSHLTLYKFLSQLAIEVDVFLAIK